MSKVLISTLLFALSLTASLAGSPEQNWPQWRGPLCTGASPTADPPVRWSQTNNVKWKAAVPGSGFSTPIVWDNKVFLLSAEPVAKASGNGEQTSGQQAAHRFLVLCFDRTTGKQAWIKSLREETPHEGHHRDHGFASGSPVTDGELLVAYFGSRGLHCLDLDGNVKWSKDLGKMQTRNSFGEGASPALYGNHVIVSWDDETENDFIVAFDKNTGKELWRSKRNETTGWSTPLVVNHQGAPQVIVNSTGRVRAYDVRDGNELWQCGGQTQNPIPTPVAAQDTVYVTSGFRGSAVMAIALGRSGDLTGTDAIRWSRAKNTPYVPSPLLAGEFLYLVTGNNPVFTCLDTKTGTPHFEGERFEGLTGVYASPVSAKDRVYLLGRNGTCIVLKKGEKPEVLARNSIEEKTDASMALAGKEIFIRSHQSLFCIAE